MLHLFKWNSEGSGALFAVFMVLFGVLITTVGFLQIKKDLDDKKKSKE
jgi:hypothetical protein